MNPEQVTIPLAFVAGLLSFVSPCVLPLVPAYLGYVGGTAALSAGRRFQAPFVHSLAFVLGFAAVFVLLGASATFLGRLLFDYKVLLARVGGVLLLVFGLRMMGAGWSRRHWLAAAIVAAAVALGLGVGARSSLAWGELGPRLAESALIGLVVLAGVGLGSAAQIGLGAAAAGLNLVVSPSDLLPRLVESALIGLVVALISRAELFYRDTRFELKPSGQSGLARSLLFGVVFAAGWTPCLGPVLAAILLLASQLDTVAQGVLLLSAYSLGLGVPFLLVGLAFWPLSGALRKLNRYLGVVSLVSGLLLALMGLLIFTDSLGFLARYGSLFEF